MYYQDASWLDTAGRLLMVAFFLAVGLRNLQQVHVEDHVKRLTNFKAPFPRITFWVGQAMEFIGCALVLFNWYPPSGWCCCWYSPSWPPRCCGSGRSRGATGMQNGMLANIGIVGGLLLLLQHVR